MENNQDQQQNRQQQVVNSSSLQRRSSHSNMRKKRTRSKQKMMQTSSQEQYERIKFQFYEFQDKLEKLSQFAVTACQTPTQNSGYNLISIREQLADLKANFSDVQSSVLHSMEQSNNQQQRQKSKNQRYKKLLKEYQTQTSIMVQDQKEFEESIKKEHNTNQDKIKTLLDKFEKQVALKKNTINTLHEHRKDNYEKLMDDAVNKIRNYFNKIEGQAQERPELSQRTDGESDLTAASVFEPINVLRKFISTSAQGDLGGSDLDDSGLDDMLNQSDASLSRAPPEPRHQAANEVQIQAPKLQNISKVNIPPIPLEQIGRVPIEHKKVPADHQQPQTSYTEMSAIIEPSGEGPSFNEEEKNHSDLIMNKFVLGAVARRKPEWDSELEDESSQSMLGPMATERLRQFTEDYENLMHVEDDNDRILIKNQLFEVYGKIIRKQIKKEKKAKEARDAAKAGKAEERKKKKREQEGGALGTGALDGLAIKAQPQDASDGSQIVNMSNISLQSALPPFRADEGPEVSEYMPEEVNINEILAADMSIGLQTATQKSLIKRIEEDYKQREAMKKALKDNEAQLDYDSFVASASRASVGNQQQAKVSDRALAKNKSNQDLNYNSNTTDNVEKANKLIFIDESGSNVSMQDLKSRRERHAAEHTEASHQKISNESSSVSGKGTIVETNKSVKSTEKEPTNSNIVSAMTSKAAALQKSPDQRELLPSVREQPVAVEDVELEFDSYQPVVSNLPDTRHQPNMEVIKERQSEFSMSILNDARAANSYRSRQSKGLSQFYENASIKQHSRKEASANQSSLLRSEAHSHSSTNVKRSKKTRESFEANDSQQKYAIKTSDKKQNNQQIARCNSQAHMHEQVDLSQLEGERAAAALAKAESVARIDKQRPIVTRNKANKVYKTSNSIQYTNSSNVMQSEGPGEYCNQFLHKLKAKELNYRMHRRNQDEIGTKRPSSSSLLQMDPSNVQAKQQYTQLNTERDRENLTQNFFNKQPYSHRSHFPAEPSSRQNDSLDASPAPSKLSRPKNLEKAESRKEVNTKVEYEAFGSDICMGPISHVCIEGDSSVQNQFGMANNTGQYSHMNMMPSIQHTSYPSDASSRLNMIDVNFGQGAPLAHADPIAIDTSKVSQSLKPLNEVVVQQVDDQMSPLIQKMRNDSISNDFTEKVQKQEAAAFDGRPKLAGQRGLVRSSSECLLRDKEFYDMADDEDEVAVYCKMQEQGVLDVFYQRNLSELQNKAIAHLKNSTNGNTQGFSGLTHEHPVAKLAELSSQGKLIFMSQQTVNKMQQRAMQTQSKTFERGLISEQMAGMPLGTAGGNIFENVNENTGVDKNSSQQQTRGKATFNKMFGMKGLNQLYLANPNLNQALIGTNLLMTSFENVTQPLYNHIMVPTHQYNRKTLLMMQNLHNNYLYSANTGILFTGRGLTSGLVQGIGKKTTTIGGHNTNNGTNEQSFVVNMAGDSLKVPFERQLVKNSTQESLQQQFERNVKEGLGGMAIRENVYMQPNETNSISGEPINIQNFIRGAKQQNESVNLNQLSQGNCISIIDDDCKMAVDRRFLQEVKNLSHQLKGRKLFSQSNKQLAQQTSSDFSQQLTEQRFSTNQPGIGRVDTDSIDQHKQLKQRESSSSVLTRKAFSIKNNPKILQLIKDKVQAQQLNRKQANNSALVGGLGHSQSKTQLGDYETVRNMRAQGLGTQMALHRRLADNVSSQSFRKLTKLSSDEQPQLQSGVAKTKLRKVSLGRRELSENSKNYVNPTHRSDQNYSSQTSTNFANLMAGLKKISHKQQLKKMGGTQQRRI